MFRAQSEMVVTPQAEDSPLSCTLESITVQAAQPRRALMRLCVDAHGHLGLPPSLAESLP